MNTRALVLGYHRIAVPPTDPWSLCVSPAHFAEQLQRLCARVRPEPLEDIVLGSQVSGTAIVLTFDDGYADTLWAAKPLLESFNVPATVFLPTGCIGSDREFWWDALEHLLLTPGRILPPLRITIDGQDREWRFQDTYSADVAGRYRHWRAWEEAPTEHHAAYREMWELLGPLGEDVRRGILDGLFTVAGLDGTARETHRLLHESEAVELGGGQLVRFGAHTVTHAMLAALSTDQQREEISTSKAWIEALVKRPVTTFAYPFGQKDHFTSETMTLVRDAGFLCACANFPDLVTPNTNRYEIPRLQVHDWDGEEFDRVLDGWLVYR
jgi:peptidoglycan/xylan/chitin deacetylase (PgdA/CDA1 family)